MARTETAGAAAPALVEVTLDKPHTHKGKQLPAGAKINVTKEREAWLKEQGVVGGKQEEQSNG
jgi:hypothetical protein